MNCKELNKSIIAFIEKDLTPDKENEFKKHLIECSKCVVLYSDITATYNAFGVGKEIEPKAFFTESVMSKLDRNNGKENILDITLDIAISKFFKKFAYTGVAFIIALFILLYTTDNLFLFNSMAEEDDFSTDNVSSVIFENF